MSAEVTAARRELKRLIKRVDASYDIYLQSLVKSRDGSLQGRLFRQHMRCCLEAEQAAPAARVSMTSSRTLAERRSNHIKTLTVKQRRRLAPHLKAGLSGRSLEMWVEEGLSLAEQIEADRLAGRITKWAYVPPPPAPRVSVEQALGSDGGARFTAAQVAAKLDVEPRRVRQTARKLRLDVRAGFTLDEAKQIKGALK